MVLTESNKMLEIGAKAPDFSVKGTDGKIYTLDSFKDKKLLLVVFMCNHCPYVKPKIEPLKELQEKYNDDLAIIGINSNDPTNYPEDSFENMQRLVEEKGINFVYAVDETQEVAKAYGASCTPDPFLFDEERKLVFHGRINDEMEPGQPITEKTMDVVIRKVLNGEKLEQSFIPSIGCSIKWKE
ncbi:thioredoxin family protein [Candidatus Woesearchaeota archaeon]|nr:MAG: thioredoxin family protein [Candidatus Woesearchaeota archaeon]